MKEIIYVLKHFWNVAVATCNSTLSHVCVEYDTGFILWWLMIIRKILLNVCLSSLQRPDSSLLSAGLVALAVLEKTRVKCADTCKHAHTNKASLSSKNICFIVTRQWQLSSGDLTHNCELAAWVRHSLFSPYHILPQFPHQLQNHIFPTLCFSHAFCWMSCHLLLVYQFPLRKSHLGLWHLGRYSTETSPTCQSPPPKPRLKQGTLYLKLPFMSQKCYCKTNKSYERVSYENNAPLHSA